MTQEPQVAEPGSALDILTNSPDQVDERLIILSNGVRLHAKPVPRTAIRRAVTSIADPQIPMATLTDGREEPNPADPAYEAEWTRVHLERIQAATRVMVTLGLEVEALPDGFPGPESDDWIDQLAVAGVEVRRSPAAARWYDWIDLYAVVTEADSVRVFWACQRATGTMEVEVAAAMRFFQGLATR